MEGEKKKRSSSGRLAFRALSAIVGNERSSAVLLKYEGIVLAEVERRIAEQKAKLDDMRQRIATLDGNDQRFFSAMELEVFRWQYLIKTYHSVRFRKIQALACQLIDPEREKMSDPESSFYENVVRAVTTALHREHEADVPIRVTPEEEDLSQFVFFSPVEDLGQQSFSDIPSLEALELKRGQIYFARMRHVKPLLEPEGGRETWKQRGRAYLI
jgi:hypothetical protein